MTTMTTQNWSLSSFLFGVSYARVVLHLSVFHVPSEVLDQDGTWVGLDSGAFSFFCFRLMSLGVSIFSIKKRGKHYSLFFWPARIIWLVGMASYDISLHGVAELKEGGRANSEVFH